MSKLNKKMGGDFLSGASESFKKKNPHLFPPTSGQGGLFMWGEAELRRRTNALIRENKQDIQSFMPQPPNIAKFQSMMQRDRASFAKNALFAATPIAAPTSLLGNFFATRQIFSALSGTKTGQGLIGRVGLSGAGGSAIATGVVMPALLAVGFALKGLEKIVKGVSSAFEQARSLYAKALTSGGLGLGFTARRETLASIIGVSAKDVYQFGQAVLYLNPKLQFATNIMAKTTPSLTAVAWNFGILKTNIEAAFMTLGNDVAPALRMFADGLSNITRAAIEFHDKVLSTWWAQGLIGSVTGAFKAVGMAGGGKDPGAAPQPLAFMKQVHASALERMGLITSGVGGFNYAAETARNTKNTAELLKKLLATQISNIKGNAPINSLQSYQ